MWLDDGPRMDHIIRIVRRVSGPGLGIARPAAQGFLAEYNQFMIIGHQFAQPVDVPTIDAVDEADHSRDRRQPLAAHAINVDEPEAMLMLSRPKPATHMRQAAPWLLHHFASSGGQRPDGLRLPGGRPGPGGVRSRP